MNPNPLAAATFVRQRLANLQARRASGDDFGSWFVSGVGRYLGRYAQTQLDRRRAGPELRARLTRHDRLNFGCGYDKREGFVNVDLDRACRPDVLVSPSLYREFPAGHYRAIVAKDVLEHVPRAQTLPLLLRFNDWLAVGGTLELQVPSILAIAEQLQKRPGFASHYGITSWLYGNQAHAGDFHYLGFTEATLKVFLLTAGFSFGDYQLADGWMFQLVVRKEKSWFRWGGDAGSDEAFAREVFSDALERGPEPDEQAALIDRIGRVGRREAALEIFARPERLLALAKRLGL